MWLFFESESVTTPVVAWEKMPSFTCWGVAHRACWRKSAASSDTCGVAMEVPPASQVKPSLMTSSVCRADLMLVPGAKMSTLSP